MTCDLNPREQIILAALTRAANNALTCPGNRELADLCGCASVSSPVNAMHILERRGLIHVERNAKSRRITIVRTGKATAPITGKSHWSARGVIKSAPADREVPVEKLADDQLPAPVNREPCPRCGTRRDFGCTHSASRLGVELSL